MLATLLALACKQEEPPLPLYEEPPPPVATATLFFDRIQKSDVSQLWLVFDRNPPLEEPPEPGPALETCQPGRYPSPEPHRGDTGEITVRLYGRVDMTPEVVELWGDYPAGATVWFEASGGRDTPAFRVPELMALPDPVEDVLVEPEEDGLLVSWTPAGDDTVMSLFVYDLEHGVTCTVEDDGEFFVSPDDLEREFRWILVVRTRSVEIRQGDVLVRGIARHMFLDRL